MIRRGDKTRGGARGAAGSKQAGGAPIGRIGLTRDSAEHKQPEAALLERGRLMSLVTENVPAMIAYFDAELICRFANTAFCGFHRLDPRGVIGKTLREIVGENTYRVIRPSIDLVKEGKPTLLRRQEHTAAGGIRHIEIHRVPDISPEGVFHGYYAMMLDVTTHVRAEETRASLATIVEHSNDAIISRALDGTILSWNAAAERLFGYTTAEAIGRPVTFFMPPGRQSNLARNTERVLGGEIIAPHETQRVTKDGRVLDILISHSPIRNSTGEITGASVILRDISALKQAQTAMKESEERFRAVFEQAGVGMGLRHIDPRNPRWLRVNQKLCDILGYTREELLQLSSVDITAPEERQIAIEYNEKLVRGEIATYSREKRYVRKDGQIIWVNITLTPVYGPDGRQTHVISVIQDISERKQAEERLRKVDRARRVMAECNRVMVHADDETQLLRDMCRTVIESGGYRMAWVGFAEHDEHKSVRPVAQAGFDEGYLEAARISWGDNERGRGPSGRAIRLGRTYVVRNALTDPNFAPWRVNAVARGYRSHIALPLANQGTAFGVLSIYATEVNAFDTEEIALLEELAGDISFALDHIARQEKLDKLARIRAVSGEINAAIVRIREREALLKETCRIVVEQGKFELVWIALVDQKMQEVRPIVWAGFSPEIARAVNWATTGKAGVTLAEVMATRKIAVRNDIEAEAPVGILRQEALKQGCRSTVCLPLVLDNTVVAAINLFATGTNFFDKNELELLNEVAVNISFALQSIVRQQKIDKLSRTRAVSSGINSILIRVRNRQELFQQSCRVAVEDGQFPFAWIGVLDPATLDVTPVAWAGKDAEELTRGKSSARDDTPRGQGAVGKAIRERRPVFNNDIPAHGFGGARLKEILRLGFQSQITLPLFEGKAVIGTLTMYARELGFFDEEEIKLLSELAGDISFALAYIAKDEKLNYLAYYDALTGLPNRALFDDRMAQVLRTASHEKSKTALVLIDLERFRHFNDTLGRSAADDLLKLVAQRLQSGIFDRDSLARVQADAFAGLFPGIKDEADIARIVEGKVIACLSQPFTISGQELRVSAKIGVALFPGDALAPDALYSAAEAALNQAKKSSDRYLFYARKMNAQVAERLKLENKLQRALERDEFVLFYQPKVDLRTGRVAGLEALMRWNDPDSGLVLPMQFIPLLEETGMIVEAGAWAMKQSVSQFAAWRAAGLTPLPIAVNVSQVQLKRKDFVASVEKAIAGTPGHGLEIEITESMIMEDIEASIEKLKTIRALGVGISIDDFGTGHSSLRYLTQLPITALKIDRAFIEHLATNSDDAAIVSTVIALGHNLRLKVIAEGVETVEQSKFLQLLGCDEFQGYLFSKPVPAEQVPALLARAGVQKG